MAKIPGILVNLTISQWSARKHDRKVTAEVNREHGASADAGRYNKHLMAREHLAEINSAITELRTWHYGLTLPWFDNGPRVIVDHAFIEHTNGFRTRSQTLDEILAKFRGVYPDLVENERSRLNGMFDPADYPSAAAIGRKFQWTCRYYDMPDVPDFRIDLADDAAKAAMEIARSEAKASLDDAMKNAMGDVWNRIRETVGKMSDRLGSYAVDPATGKVSNPFRDSLVSNVTDLCDLLPKLNLTGDPAIDAMIAEMRVKLTSAHPDALRASDKLRDKVKADADAILSKLSGVF